MFCCRLFGIGKQNTEEKRTIILNDPVSNKRHKFARNSIKTTKYNAVTFIPINLFEQLKRVANIYFLVLMVIQLLPINLSSVSAVTTIIPLVIVFTVTAVKDAIDDIRRRTSDNKINNRKTSRIQDGKSDQIKWKHLRVGEMIKLENDDFIPADMVILSSSENHAVCYIETAELDGETNLKMRQGLKETEHITKPKQISQIRGRIVCEQPNNNLNDFQGDLILLLPEKKTQSTLQLNNNNVLLRGCRLRNTPWVVGIVIFAGKETKLVQNSGKAAFKRTHLDKLLNILVLTIFIFLFLLCLIASMCAALWEEYTGDPSLVYLPPQVIMDKTYDLTPAAYMGLSFVAYVILLNTVVPISLYVTVEVIRLGLSLFIDWDEKMWFYEGGVKSEEFKPRKAKARSTNLNEELGQVKYIFSDKTGTLTQNKMVFKMCSINGTSFGHSPSTQGDEFTKVEYIDDEQSRMTSSVGGSSYGGGSGSQRSFFLPEHKYQQSKEDSDFTWSDKSLTAAIEANEPAVREFLTAIALCHTVLPEAETDKETQKIVPESLKYQAQSPDEAALLTAARAFGFTFTARTPEEIEVSVMDDTEFYQLLGFIDFNNDRKRMSVVVRGPFKQGDNVKEEEKKKPIVLYCKGADNLIFDRLNSTDSNQTKLKEKTSQDLEKFAAEGLRTLVLAKKPMDEKFFKDWDKRYDKALKNPDDKKAIEDLEEELEGGMSLLGATAIEDKLQDHVADTIQSIHVANIKLWVLTGDKLETAMNIGYSCKMLQDESEMEVCIIESENPLEILQELTDIEQMLDERDKLDNPDNKRGTSTEEVNAVSNFRGGIRMNSHDQGSTGDRGSSEGSSKKKSFAIVITGSALKVIEEVSEKNKKNNKSSKSSASKSKKQSAMRKSTNKPGGGEDKATLLDTFLEVGCRCHTVICSRVTPGQKALVVEWVKNKENAITLAIGDGANDVSMIKKAHIGVGVEGNEGMQAVMNSDYSIAQFYYLKRLLLLHGHWSYHRMSFFLRYFFYKNFAFSLMQFWFAMYCGFSAQSIYDSIFITMYNMAYTALPVIAIGLFDKDVGSKYCMTFPQIYCVGQEDKLFNKFVFFQSVLHGVWHSIVIFFVTVGLYSNYTDSSGLDYTDYYSFVAAIQANLVLVVNIQAMLDTKNWTVFNHLFIWGSVASFYIIQITCSLPHLAGTFIYDWFGTSGSLFKILGTVNYWFSAMLSICLCILPVLALRTLELDLRPSYIDMMRIISKKKRQFTKQTTTPQRTPVKPAPRRRTSSYAFSHSEGFGRMVKQGSYLEDPNEFTTSRVHIGSRGRSASRVLPTHPEVDEIESAEKSNDGKSKSASNDTKAKSDNEASQAQKQRRSSGTSSNSSSKTRKKKSRSRSKSPHSSKGEE
ncbi:putative phospholipid-transporting ATPase IM isoform X2 [Convolutriloba macropyga]|uniref:putative phospholipid-transporting ATPase IM isoform X2 n=1 Tax=Convolutriloba macropyga TaxID=536237 RepID=UPI003F521C9D